MHAATADDRIQACENMGPKERARRKRHGVAFTVVSVLVAGALLKSDAQWPARLTLALPVMLAAMGFLQARARTCVAFVAGNIKVMGDSRGDRVRVTDENERAAFKQKARMLVAQGAAVTAVVVALFLLVP